METKIDRTEQSEVDQLDWCTGLTEPNGLMNGSVGGRVSE